MFHRSECKQEARSLLRTAQVPWIRMAALYYLIVVVLNTADLFSSGSTYEELWRSGPLGIFVFVLTSLILLLLQAGVVLYCMGVRRGERMEYGDLFSAFSFAFRVIGLELLMALYIFLWTLALVVPGIIAVYRYRYALYILCEDPSVSPAEAIRRSSAQTAGYKSALFVLDLSFLGWGILAALPAALVSTLYEYGLLAASWLTPSVTQVICFVLEFPIFLLVFYYTATDLGVRERILRQGETREA